MPAPRTHTDVLQVGSTFGRYRIERVVGRGGMGAVYEATHLELNKRVALKTLLPAVAENPEVRARFLREGQSVARIRHPNVADVYDVGTQDEISFLVMEFLDGEDLGALLKRERSLPAERAADIMLPVLAAISVAHEEHIIHRDLKPANIFLSTGRRGELVPKVVDFGISKIINDDVSEALTSTGAVIGTPFYMSPEQANGDKHIDARTDLYSLGVILYQMVTGKRPFQADSMYQILHKIVLGKFEPPRALSPQLSEALERVILTAMALRPADRYASAFAMGAALLSLASPRLRNQWEPIFAPGGAAPVPEDRTPRPSATATFPPRELPPPGVAAAEAARENSGSSSFTGSGERREGHTTILPSPKSLRAGLLGALGALALGAGGLIFYLTTRGPTEVKVVDVVQVPAQPPAAPPPPRTYAVTVRTVPAGAELELDGRPIGRGSIDRTLEADGREHTLKVSAPGHQPTSVVFKDAPPPKTIVLEPLPPAEPPPAPVKKASEKPRPPRKDEPKKGANEAPILR